MVVHPTANLPSGAIAAAVLAILTTAAQAAPTSLAFSYTFDSGRVLAGSLVAEVQPDGDTVFIESFGSVTFDGVALSRIEPSDIRSVSDYPYGLLQPLVSFSGEGMDVFVCAQGFLDGNCGFRSTGGFSLNTTNAYIAAAGDGQGAVEINYGLGFLSERWVLVPVLVPEPAAASLLLAIGLGGLAARRASERRRRSA